MCEHVRTYARMYVCSSEYAGIMGRYFLSNSIVYVRRVKQGDYWSRYGRLTDDRATIIYQGIVVVLRHPLLYGTHLWLLYMATA